jgi:hypothetical protein
MSGRGGAAAALAVLSLVLAGCGTASPPPVQCPPVANYTDAQLAAIQQSIDRLAKDDPLRGALQDYENLRDDSRYCANLLKERG